MTISYSERLRRDFFKNLMRVRFLWIVCAIALCLTGCASTPRYLRWYEGPALESNKVAILKIHQDSWHAVMVNVIDGASIRKSKKPEFNNTETIELLPGKHQLAVSYLDTHGHSFSDTLLNFTGEAGHLHDLFAASEKRASEQVPGAGFFGVKYYWSPWIIDAETKEIVAGEKLQHQPIHYQSHENPKGAAAKLHP